MMIPVCNNSSQVLYMKSSKMFLLNFTKLSVTYVILEINSNNINFLNNFFKSGWKIY